MPLFEFQCEDCGNDFEELVWGDEQVSCPACENHRVRRKMSRFAFKSEGGRMRTTAGGSSCATCRPGPSGCSGCGS